MTVESVRALDEREKWVSAVKAHPHAGKIAAFCHDLLMGQARGKALIVGRDYASTRAEAHGLSRDEAQTSFGNVREWMERGLKDGREYALVSAFAVLGARLDARVRWGDLRPAWDWLELNSDFALYPFVEALLPEDMRRKLWEQVQRATESVAATPRAQGERAFHFAVLRDYAVSWEGASEEGHLSVQGGAWFDRTATRGAQLRHVLGWVTGLALLRWLLRGVFWILGGRHRSMLTMSRAGVRVTGDVVALGKVIRSKELCVDWSSVVVLETERRFPFLLSFVGVASFSLGLLAGGLFLFNGVRSGETILLIAGAGIALSGAGLDLLAQAFNALFRGRGTLTVRGAHHRTLVVAGIPTERLGEVCDSAITFQSAIRGIPSPTKVYRGVDVGHSVP